MPNTIGLRGIDQAFVTDDGRLAIDPETLVWASAPSFTRPNDSTAYTIGDLVANNTAAASVVLPIFPVVTKTGGDGYVLGWRMSKTGLTATNANFRLHLFVATPTVATAGDNGAIASDISALAKGYVGYMDMTAMTGFADSCWGYGVPPTPVSRLPFMAAVTQLYGILVAMAAYTPSAQEVFQLDLLIGQK